MFSDFYMYLGKYLILLRLALLLFGFLFLYVGLFLYETEQGKVQNRLEEWWCKLDDRATAGLNRNLRVLQGTALYFHLKLKSTFGERLFSLESIGVCICWGMISAKLTIVVIGFLGGNRVLLLLGQFVGILAFFYLSKGPKYLPSTKRWFWFGTVLLLWITVIISAYASGKLGNTFGTPLPTYNTPNVKIVRLGIAVLPLYTLGVLVCTVFTLVFVRISQHCLQYVMRSDSKRALIRALLIYGSFLGSAIALHLGLSDRLRTPHDFRSYIFLMSTPTMGYAYWMTIIMIFLVLNMCLWALIKRPLYALQRIGGERRNKLFVVVGLLMLGLAFPQAREAIKTVISSFKSIVF